LSSAPQASSPAPAVDDEGTPVKVVPAPAPSNAETNFTDILTDLGQKLDEQFKNLNGGADDPDKSTAKAMAALSGGDSNKALKLMSAFAEKLRTKHALSKLHGKEKVAAAFKLQMEGRSTPTPTVATSPGLALSEKLPRPSDNPAQGVDLNEKYRAALGALDAEISACAEKGRPISQDLLGRRNRVNREWLAINRRKN
jgi:hypothetical protein